MDIFPVVYEDCCLLSATYNYPLLGAGEYYLPPREDYPGDLNCDCNTVMYMYEVQAL